VLIVVFLLTITFTTQADVDEVSDNPDLTVKVTAAKWNWRFDYPDQLVSVIAGQSAPTTLVVPQNRTVRFEVISLDVIHSFWIPEVRFKRDAFPKRTNTFDLTFEKTGTFPGRCAEFCGLKHAEMLFNVDVKTEEAFNVWVRQQRVRQVQEARARARDRLRREIQAERQAIRERP
jgi:cytochrome c oxidase subunit 2